MLLQWFVWPHFSRLALILLFTSPTDVFGIFRDILIDSRIDNKWVFINSCIFTIHLTCAPRMVHVHSIQMIISEL